MAEHDEHLPVEERGAHEPPSAADIQHQLTRILESADFKKSSRLADFLAYIVEETLQGREHRIKAYSIGIEVLGRDATFDPQLDPVVRIEAGRLRRDLEHYYLTVGSNDPVVIDIPKGGYIPKFRFRRQPAEYGGLPHEPADLRVMPASMPALSGGHWGRWKWAATAAILASLLMLMWVASVFDRINHAPRNSADSGMQPSVLVLPLVDLGGGNDTARRGAAISDELTARMARFREVAVISAIAAGASALADPKTWPSTAFLLDGSVRSNSSHLRVAVRLTNRASGTVLWSDIYDLDLKAVDGISLEQDVASRVATAVAQPYGVLFRSGSSSAMQNARTGMADRYECALDFYAYRQDLGVDLHKQVRTCLQHSLEGDPDSATAWAMLSLIYLDEDRYGYNRNASPPPIERALEAARHAIQLDPSNVRALQALMTALFFDREPDEALRVGEEAYRLNPNDTELLGEYGSRLMQVGQRARGMAMMEEALERNPGNTGLYAGQLAVGAYLTGDDKRALTMLRRADLQRFPIYHFVAALVFARNGLSSEAATSRDTFLRMRPDFFADFDAELDKRNFDAEDRATIIAGARSVGFPVPPDITSPSPRRPTATAY